MMLTQNFAISLCINFPSNKRWFPSRDLCVVCGPQGFDRSIMINMLMSEFAGRFAFPIPHTTRCPRQSEQEGVDYNFVTKERMAAEIKAGHFIEFTHVDGDLYGTSIAAVESIVSQQVVCLLDLDRLGVDYVRRSYLCENASFVYFIPPSMEVLKQRLSIPGHETEESAKKLLDNAEKEMAMYEGEQES